MPKVKILDIYIDNLNKSEVSHAAEVFLKQNRPHLITTVNPEIVLEAQNDPVYKEILNKADLSVPDGFGLILASLYLRKKLKKRITGLDLMDILCSLSSRQNYSIYLLGSLGRVAEKAAVKMLQKWPTLKIVGTENGFRFWGLRLSDQELVRKINRARPDILFVAFGAPKQEKWLFANLPQLKTVKIGVGVGGAFDFLSGKVKRAPLLFRKVGLEWLWRLINQPWRFRRVFNATVKFSLKVLKNKK